MITYFGSRISPNQVETAEGFLICRNVPIARIGEQIYLARELMLDGDPERKITVHRYPEDVFDRATIASFEGKPVTDTHPADFVDPENFKELSKGHVQNVRKDGDYIVADLYINDASLIDKIKNGTREVSCGYVCTYEPEGDDYKQTHIRGNHVAVVQMGRAGHEVAIKDAAAKTAEKGRTLMSKFEEILAAFGLAAKDAQPEEVSALAKLTSLALDAQEAEPAEEAPEAAPAEESKDEMVEKAPKGDDLGTKLDKLIEMVGSLLEKGEKGAKDADVSEVIEEEESVADACGEEAKDFMSILAPALNGISDKKQKSDMTKALLAAMSTDSMKDILEASGKAAKKASDSSNKTSYEKACADAESAYASRNPHIKKEVK